MEDYGYNAPPPAETPSPADQPLSDQRKAFKASIRPAGRAVLLFMLFQQFGTGIVIAIMSMASMFRDPNAMSSLLNPVGTDAIQQAAESVVANLSDLMWIMVIFSVLAYLLVVVPWRRIRGVKEDMQTRKRMPFVTGVMFTCLAVSMQLIYILVMPLLSGLIPSLYNGMDAINELLAEPSSLIFASLVGPIVEELVFRGALISALKRHGKWYAILVSSILFGLYHANLPQGAFAFGIGLVLGYVALEYSIEWSITIHIFNNFVLGQLPTLLAGSPNDTSASVIAFLMVLMLGTAGLVFAFQKRQRIADYLRDNRIPERQLRWTFTQGCFLALAIICVGQALQLLMGR